MSEMTYLLGFLIIVLFVALWLWFCNEITYRQRMRLINRRPRGAEFWDYCGEWGAVTYDRHLWTMFSLRNPRHLYGPLTQKIW